MVQMMNALVVFNSLFVLANIALGDEEHARLDTAIALLSSDGSSGSGGSGGTSAGGANIFQKIFGAEADAFGGIGGNPFSLSFLNTVMADMGDNLGTLALLEAINSQSSSKTTSGVDMTSASMAGDSSGFAAGFSGGIGVGGGGGIASSVGGGGGVASSVGGGGGVGSGFGGGGGIASSVGGGGGIASSVGGGGGIASSVEGGGGIASSVGGVGGVASSFGRGGGVGSSVGGGGGITSSVGGGGGVASSVGGGGSIGSSFGGGGGVAGAGAWNMANGLGFRKDNIGGFGMSAHGGTTTGLETLLSMNDRGWGSGWQGGAGNWAGVANARDNWSSGLGRSDFHKIRPFPIPSQFSGPSIASSSASALSSDALMNNLHAFQGIGQDVGSLGSNINLNAFLSALIAARQSSGIDTNFIGDKLWSSPRLQNFDNQQNIASIMSSLQSRSQQAPVVIIGLDSFGNVKQVGNGRGIIDAINRRDFSFDSRLDRDMGFDSRWGERDRGFSRWDRDSRFKSLPSQESPAKDINLNIVVRQDQPVEKPRSHSSADKMTQENDLSLINTNDLAWFEFNNVDSSTGRFQQADLNRKGGDAKGHPVFSFKASPPVQQTIGGSSGMESYWKDSLNGAQIKPIPNMVARQQLDNFIAGTNRGDLWNQIGTHKG